MKIIDVVFVYHLEELWLQKWHTRRHSHEDGLFEFHYFLEGDGSFQNGDRIFEIKRNSLFLSRPNEEHAIIPGGSARPLTYYALLFELERPDNFADLMPDPGHVSDAFPIILDPVARLKFEEIKGRYLSPNPFFKRAAEFDVLSLIHYIFGLAQAPTPESPAAPAKKGNADLLVDQAVALLQNYLDRNVQLSQVAETLRISEEYLIKIFRDRFGLTPMKYYQKLRLEASVSLLLNTALSVKEIAARLGYSSQYHYSRNFKQLTGIPPSTFRDTYFRDNPTEYHAKILDTRVIDGSFGSGQA